MVETPSIAHIFPGQGPSSLLYGKNKPMSCIVQQMSGGRVAVIRGGLYVRGTVLNLCFFKYTFFHLFLLWRISADWLTLEQIVMVVDSNDESWLTFFFGMRLMKKYSLGSQPTLYCSKTPSYWMNQPTIWNVAYRRKLLLSKPRNATVAIEQRKVPKTS